MIILSKNFDDIISIFKKHTSYFGKKMTEILLLECLYYGNGFTSVAHCAGFEQTISGLQDHCLIEWDTAASNKIIYNT